MNDGCFIVILLLVFGFLFGFAISEKLNTPSAMEVYQGKTTLEYKIVDGEVVDSTVVYKKK